MPLLEEQFKADVDGMINMELENMRVLFASSKKKKEGKEEGKKEEEEKEEGTQAPRLQVDQGHVKGRDPLHLDLDQHHQENSVSKPHGFHRRV